MKAETKVILAGIWMLLGTGAPAFAGVESSGGADKYLPQTAWFLASAPSSRDVRVCYVVSDDFGVLPLQLDNELNAAFITWDEYLTKKQVQDDPLHYATRMSLMSACDGSEDLKIYFGVTDAQVAAAKAKYVKPFGFVEKTGGDALWSKGFLYVAPPAEIAPAPAWTTGNHLRGLLLHELGHILGCSHLDGTIMAEDIGQDLLFSNSTDTLDRIDRARELRPCTRCARTYAGEATYGNTFRSVEAFTRLVGRAPVGEILAVYAQDEMIEHVNEDELPTGRLTLKDSISVTVFQIQGVSKLAFSEIDVPLFKTPTSALFSYGYIDLATLTAPDGRSWQVTLNYDLDFIAFHILLLDGQPDPENLFVSDGSNLSL
jgi:hypothetical protein